jgi:hypothetical protein
MLGHLRVLYRRDPLSAGKADPRLGHQGWYSGVPPGRGPHGLPDPAINRRATVICPSGTKKALSSRHSDLSLKPSSIFYGGVWRKPSDPNKDRGRRTTTKDEHDWRSAH